MKTKLLLSAMFSLAVISSTLANHINTSLNLMMFDGRPITVMVDGMPYGSVASQQEILNLAPGMHRLKVFTVQQHPFGWHPGGMIPVFRGSVEIFDNYAVYATIDRMNRLVIEDYEALLCEPVPPACPQQGYLPGYSPFPQPQYPHDNDGFHGNSSGNDGNHGTNTWNTSDNGNNWNHGHYPNGGYRYPMNQDDFSQLLSVIESKSFESTKQQIAIGALGNSYFTSEQIRQMLNVFTFESTKVEVAKKAYDRVIDPEKFYVVYNSFTFESSIDNLQASIGR